MDIQTIDIRQLAAASFTFTENNLFHKKSLPVMSVVQALEGSYQIRIGTSAEQMTKPMGAFIAPSGKMQYIIHNTNPASGLMHAHWIFFDAFVNKKYRLDDLYDFPVLLPAKYQCMVHDIIEKVSSDTHICDKLSEAYKLIKILLELGIKKELLNPLISEIELYVDRYYSENITVEKMIEKFSISKATLFRRFNASFNMTPANYINSVRLSKSIYLLETTTLPIYSISSLVGFGDPFYYSKLFKKKYDVSPAKYRNRLKGFKDEHKSKS